MNRKFDPSFPTASDAVFLEHARMKLDANGQIVYAGIGDRTIGHLTQDVRADYGGDYTTSGQSLGRAYGTVLKTTVAELYALASEGFTAGDEFCGAASGKIRAVPSDANITGTIEADDEVVTAGSAHGLLVGDRVEFVSLTGGTGLETFREYHVVSVPTTTTLTLSETRGGSAVDVTGDYSAFIMRNKAKSEGQVCKTCSANTVVRVIYYNH